MQEKGSIIVYGIGIWPLAGTFSILFSVFVLRVKFLKDFAAKYHCLYKALKRRRRFRATTSTKMKTII
jgi:hypothetical protein